MRRKKNILISLLLTLGLSGCGGGGATPTEEENTTAIPNVLPTTSFITVSDTAWNTTAVEKVLDTFAYGGHATQTQIQKWADMTPKEAIVQMLTFDAQNKLLSPTTSTLPNTPSLEALSTFWSGDDANNFITPDERSRYTVKFDAWSLPKESWSLAVMTRGLNPFAHKVGLWESNYHMSINQDSGVFPLPLLHHYDNILQKLLTNSPYEEVIAQGAKNAGVAHQYGHNKNLFTEGQFKGNEDFAREYHQLFLGILGLYDPTYHENTAIPNTARVLTDIQAKTRSGDTPPDTEVTFGSVFHYPASLDILKNTIASSPTAQQQLDDIAKIGIVHAESLDNLPVMIIEHFADDNLSTASIARIRATWRGLETKSLLSFLQSYAISTDFHNANRVKYQSSIARTMSVFNKMVVDNSDLNYQIYNFNYYLSKESIETFHPIHDVFGHQTGLEASDNSNLFQINYNRSTESASLFTQKTKRDTTWEKDWGKLIPENSTIEEIGLWLWKRFIADGGKNYGILEKAHISALLNGKDLGYFLNVDDPLHIYTLEELTSDALAIKLHDAEVSSMKLHSSDSTERQTANYRVGLAIAFIVATPYIYVQEGL